MNLRPALSVAFLVLLYAVLVASKTFYKLESLAYPKLFVTYNPISERFIAAPSYPENTPWQVFEFRRKGPGYIVYNAHAERYVLLGEDGALTSAERKGTPWYMPKKSDDITTFELFRKRWTVLSESSGEIRLLTSDEVLPEQLFRLVPVPSFKEDPWFL
ncbi:hypothetical protein EC973_008141 [Apophysomyces ossiformis]|uniref:Uncharacterized protein n=1 Tax=Apophysomyces ossiformis TaxID=679940 RepID=A0A8H7ELI4_9FUNG|nr:hypothetical protein EC973_008141 [Apophysomyces ossiformis]